MTQTTPQGPDHRRRHRRPGRGDLPEAGRHRRRGVRGLALLDRHRRRPADRAERHACAGRDRPRRRDDPPRLDRGILRLLFAVGRPLGSLNRNMEARFGQPAVNMCRATLNEMLINKAWCANVELHFEKRLVAHRGPRRPAGRRPFRRRHHGRGRFRHRRRRRAFGGARPCRSPTAQNRSTPA